ncbi:MAG: hypothetical protein J6T51_02185, partial [Kiritimatiellae bacterium]|nr:hypothetical protein [Kiritimatiellia bacterium]
AMVALFGMGAALAPEARKAVESCGASDAPSVLRAGLPERFPCKYWFVDLNGGACRMAGRRICNDRMLFADGSLDCMYAADDAAVARFVASTASLAGYIEGLGVPFLYVQAPYKHPLEGGLAPPGWPLANLNDEALRAVSALEGRGVRTLDLVRALAATRKDVAANFYPTDHHWRGRAALKAARLVSRRLSDVLGDASLRSPPQLRAGNWERRVERGAFLGSHGRRTGRFFAGTDDFEYFVPKFRTDIARYMGGRPCASGEFVKSVLEMRFLSKGLHERNAYGVYGTDRNEVAFVNGKARSSAKVLFVKDSFANPVAGFLATVCREVVKVDPRRCESRDEILRLVEKHRPDAVVMLVHPVAMRNEKFVFAGAGPQEAPPPTEAPRLWYNMDSTPTHQGTRKKKEVGRASIDIRAFPGGGRRRGGRDGS